MTPARMPVPACTLTGFLGALVMELDARIDWPAFGVWLSSLLHAVDGIEPGALEASFRRHVPAAGDPAPPGRRWYED